MLPRLFDQSGKEVRLSRELGRGGEGSVYEVAHDSGIVAKIYHQPVDPEKREKLNCMPLLATPELLKVGAWPVGTLFESRGNACRGILLPKIVAHREVHQLYSPIQRKTHFPKADWSFLVLAARNSAAAMETVHAAGYVIGDFNQGGVLVSTSGTVRLIDCDSFQIRHQGKTYRSLVGVPDYTPPELQNGNFKDFDRTTHHDTFGLAVLVFHILFMGRHPFAGVYKGVGDMPITRAITEGHFAFRRSPQNAVVVKPPHALGIENVGQRVEDLFERAFLKGVITRPSASDWRQAMDVLLSGLCQCPEDKAHWYLKTLLSCPWCDFEKKQNLVFFTSDSVRYEFDSDFKVDVILRFVLGMAPRDSFWDLDMSSSTKHAIPNPLSEELDIRKLGAFRVAPDRPILTLESLPPLPEYIPELYEERPPFQDIPIPDVSPFVPDVVPPDPVYQPLQIPVLPSEPRCVDYESAVLKMYRGEMATSENMLVKRALIVCLFLIPPSFFYWPLLLVVLLLSGTFALALVIMWVPVWSRYRRKIGKARRQIELDRQAYARQRDQVQELIDKIKVENNRREVLWRIEIERLARLRAELPTKNYSKKILWEAQRNRINIEAQSISETNRTRREEWKEHVRAHEAPRLLAWRLKVKEVEEQRKAVDGRNDLLRHAWHLNFKLYQQQQDLVDAYNSKLVRRQAECRAEIARRKENLRVIRNNIDDVLRAWSKERGEAVAEYQCICDALRSACNEYKQLRASFERVRKSITANAEQFQLDEFLRQTSIEDAQIPGIGPVRVALLLNWGIETAYDVRQEELEDVQGFGPRLRQVLYDWRGQVSARFKFDPTKMTFPPALKTLQSKYQPRRKSLQAEIESAQSKVTALSDKMSQRKKAVQAELTALLAKRVQAEADVNVLSAL